MSEPRYPERFLECECDELEKVICVACAASRLQKKCETVFYRLDGDNRVIEWYGLIFDGSAYKIVNEAGEILSASHETYADGIFAIRREFFGGVCNDWIEAECNFWDV